jgi:alkylhydroperoxidase family enzyme
MRREKRDGVFTRTCETRGLLAKRLVRAVVLFWLRRVVAVGGENDLGTSGRGQDELLLRTRQVSKCQRCKADAQTYTLDELDEGQVAGVDETRDSDTDLLSEREARLNLDLARFEELMDNWSILGRR